MRSTKYSSPFDGMPIEFSIPASVSATRGTGLPIRRLGVTLFVTTAPRRERSIASAYSCAKHPEAGMTGLFSSREPTETLRSAKLDLAGDGCDREHGAFAAYPAKHLLFALVEQAHAGQADPHGAGHLLLEGDFAAHAEPL